jgi:hypothetical protein
LDYTNPDRTDAKAFLPWYQPALLRWMGLEKVGDFSHLSWCRYLEIIKNIWRSQNDKGG